MGAAGVVEYVPVKYFSMNTRVSIADLFYYNFFKEIFFY